MKNREISARRQPLKIRNANPFRQKHISRAVGILTCSLALTGLVSATAHAQAPANSAVDARTAYSIPAGNLAATLQQAAATTQTLLTFTSDQTRGKTSAGLHGNYTRQEAFDLLLAGTGLQAVRAADGAYALRPLATAEPGDNPKYLATVNVVARAAPVPIDADDRYQPTPDASTLRTTAPSTEIPQVVNVVPAQVIRDQRPRNLDDALTNVSGITQGNTLAGTQDTIMKRGFGGNRDGSIMHNGMPLVQGHGLNAAAESVEVLKGPSSLLYGIMDPGGVVNVVSKKPQLTQHTSISMLGSGYKGGRYGFGNTLDTTGQIGKSNFAYRLIVDHVDEAYWRNFGTHQETLIAPSLAWYGKDTQVIAWYEYRKFRLPFDRGTALDPRTGKPLSVPKTERLDEPFNEMRGESHLAQVSLDHQMNHGWSAHANFSYNRETYDANQLRVNGINTTTGTLSRSNDATHGAVSTDTYGTAYAERMFEMAGMLHELQFGGDAEYRMFYRADLLRQATTSTFSYTNPQYGLENPSATVSASDSDQTDELHNQSLFAQDTINLTDKWIAVGGVRFQTWRQMAGRGRPFTANTDTSDSAWLPRAGLVYKWTSNLSLYGSYSESIKPTSTIAPLTSGVVITSAIKPEEAKSWELGAKYEAAGGLTASVAFFDIHKKNVLVSQYNDTAKQTDWRTSGAARSRGMEVDIAGQISRHWSAIGSYALIDAKTTEDPDYAGNRLWNVARQTASASAVYDFGEVFHDDRLRLGGGPHYVGKRAGDSANSFDLPDYTVFDAFATYDRKIGKYGLHVQLNVKNLFDKTYYTSSVNSYFISMGDARQVSLLTTVDF